MKYDPGTIEIDGSGVSVPQSLLRLMAPNSTVRGLALNRAPCVALEPGGGSAIVEGNFIGTDVTGTVALGNGYAACGRAGIMTLASGNNRIGGTTPASRNLISANYAGVFINHSPGNLVQGNLIGTDASGRGPGEQQLRDLHYWRRQYRQPGRGDNGGEP